MDRRRKSRPLAAPYTSRITGIIQYMKNEINQVVYAVIESSDEGPFIQGVFSTKSLAEAFLEEFRDEQDSGNLYIAEWIVDEAAGFKQKVTYYAAVSIPSGQLAGSYTIKSLTLPGESSGSNIEGELMSRRCTAWSTTSAEHAEKLALAGRKGYLHTSSIVTLTPEGNAPVASSK